MPTSDPHSGQQGCICVELAVMAIVSLIISIPVTSNPSGKANAGFTSMSFKTSLCKSLFIPVERSIDA